AESLRMQTVSSNTLNPVKIAALTVTISFALVGVYATYVWTRDYATRPRHFAKPFSFLILEIENPRDPNAPTRIYFDSPSSSKDIRFEGSKLTYRSVGLSHPQAAVLLPGYILSGEGRVVFGKAILDIKDGEVQLNGLDLCRRELVVSRSGESWQGMLRIAE
ncbi:MAG TPA: hypothetical protein VIX91_21670, partial [Candidatus Acidoferrum sp.]